jgi:hypothetical protein
MYKLFKLIFLYLLFIPNNFLLFIASSEITNNFNHELKEVNNNLNSQEEKEEITIFKAENTNSILTKSLIISGIVLFILIIACLRYSSKEKIYHIIVSFGKQN